MLEVRFKVLGAFKRPDGSMVDVTPIRKTEMAAGWDLVAAEHVVVPAVHHRVVMCDECDARVVVHVPGRAPVSTGIAIELPRGYEGQVRPRSGNATKFGVSIPNTPGTIDADYRGLVTVHLVNFDGRPFEVAPGDRIAQLLVKRMEDVTFVKVDVLSETVRGTGGFGSTERS